MVFPWLRWGTTQRKRCIIEWPGWRLHFDVRRQRASGHLHQQWQPRHERMERWVCGPKWGNATQQLRTHLPLSSLRCLPRPRSDCVALGNTFGNPETSRHNVFGTLHGGTTARLACWQHAEFTGTPTSIQSRWLCFCPRRNAPPNGKLCRFGRLDSQGPEQLEDHLLRQRHIPVSRQHETGEARRRASQLP